MQEELKNKKIKKSNKSNFYFDMNVERSIIKFQNYKSIKKKKQIFVEKIKPALDKLIENIIFTYKFHTIGPLDELKNDCICNLYENLCKFDASKRK